MEKRYLDALRRYDEYAPLVELSEIYSNILDDNLKRNCGRLDDDGKFIKGLFDRVNTMINSEIVKLKKWEKTAKGLEITAEAFL